MNHRSFLILTMYQTMIIYLCIISFKKLYSKYDMHLLDQENEFPKDVNPISTNLCNFRHSFTTVVVILINRIKQIYSYSSSFLKIYFEC